MLDGKEDTFIAEHNFPHWKFAEFQEQPATSAQAATAATTSNTIDPATEAPAVDGELFSDDAGDGVIDGMCAASNDDSDVADNDEDVPEDESDDESSSTSTSDAESDDADPNGNLSE